MASFFEAVRENTGRALCDSGDHYGRHYENPPVFENSPKTFWNDDLYALISTAHYLKDRFDIQNEMQTEWEAFEALQDSGMTTHECLMEFFITKGYVCAARDNTYNSENDLSQDMVWCVWVPRESNREWLYEDEAYTTIEVHTGCDIRGGYASPIICKKRDNIDSYNAPIDAHLGFDVVEIRGDKARVEDIAEYWQQGYSSCSGYHLEQDIKRVFEWTRTQDTVCCQTNDGDLIKIQIAYY